MAWSGVSPYIVCVRRPNRPRWVNPIGARLRDVPWEALRTGDPVGTAESDHADICHRRHAHVNDGIFLAACRTLTCLASRCRCGHREVRSGLDDVHALVQLPVGQARQRASASRYGDQLPAGQPCITILPMGPSQRIPIKPLRPIELAGGRRSMYRTQLRQLPAFIGSVASNGFGNLPSADQSFLVICRPRLGHLHRETAAGHGPSSHHRLASGLEKEKKRTNKQKKKGNVKTKKAQQTKKKKKKDTRGPFGSRGQLPPDAATRGPR